jgi:hypothetical protein
VYLSTAFLLKNKPPSGKDYANITHHGELPEVNVAVLVLALVSSSVATLPKVPRNAESRLGFVSSIEAETPAKDRGYTLPTEEWRLTYAFRVARRAPPRRAQSFADASGFNGCEMTAEPGRRAD